MATDVAFMPWIHARELITLRELRLTPYVRGKTPSSLPNVTLSDLDAMTSAYADHHGEIIRHCTLIELGDFVAGTNSDEHRVALFGAQQLIAFSALANRRLFSGLRYTNSHAYTLIVQRYETGRADRFNFETRRRDGRTWNYWAAGRFAFQRPIHVDGHATLDLDGDLLASLLSMGNSEQYVNDALYEFNSANTDSADVSEHAELVMLKSAFEALLRIDQHAMSLVKALYSWLEGMLDGPAEGPMAELWRKRWKKARGPLGAWAQDFSMMRNTAAHGGSEGPTVWGPREHLAFGSVLFPLLVKLHLVRSSLLTLSGMDRAILGMIERFLMSNPFDESTFPEGDIKGQKEHPWSEVYNEAVFHPTFSLWQGSP